MWKDTLRKAPFSGRDRQKKYQDANAQYRESLKQKFPRALENLFDDVYDKALSSNPNRPFYKLSMPSALKGRIQEMLDAGIKHNEIANILTSEYDAEKVVFSLDDGAYGSIGIYQKN